MSAVRLWRIAAETRTYKAVDLTGAGASIQPGRWNAPGEFVAYTSPSLPLAVLETAAYVDSSGLPQNRFVVAIDVPQEHWGQRERLDPAQIDPARCAVPAGQASAELGSAWYRAGKTLLLEVPSVIVQEECNILINAKHPAVAALVASVVRPFSYSTLHRG